MFDENYCAARTRHCLEMVLAAQALAGVAPDDHRQRTLARQVYVWISAFIDCGFDWRSQLNDDPSARMAAAVGRRKLRVLPKRYGRSKQVRDVLGSKRKPAAPARDDDVALTLELWMSITAAKANALIADAGEAWAALAETAEVERAINPPPVPHQAAGALAALAPEEAADQVTLSTGSYEWARPGTMGVQLRR